MITFISKPRLRLAKVREIGGTRFYMKEAWIFEEGWESDEKTGDRKTAGEAQLARKGWPREWREGDERLTTATVAEEEKEKGGGGLEKAKKRWKERARAYSERICFRWVSTGEEYDGGDVSLNI